MMGQVVVLLTALGAVGLIVCVGLHLIVQFKFAKHVKDSYPTLWHESNLSFSTESLAELIRMSFERRLRNKNTEEQLKNDPTALALFRRLALLSQSSALCFIATVLGAILMGVIR